MTLERRLEQFRVVFVASFATVAGHWLPPYRSWGAVADMVLTLLLAFGIVVTMDNYKSWRRRV